MKSQVKQLNQMVQAVKSGKQIELKTDAPKGVDEATHKAAQSHLFSKQPSLEQIKNRLQQYRKRLMNQELQLKNKVSFFSSLYASLLN